MPGAVDGGSENNDSSPPPLFVVMQEGQGLRSEERYDTRKTESQSDASSKRKKS